MAWTTQITNKSLDANGRPQIEVHFTSDSGATATQIFNSASLAVLKQEMNYAIANLTANESMVNSLTKGVFDPTPDPVTPLTKAQIDQNTWLANYRKLVKAKTTLVDTGVITTAQPTYAALLSTVQAGLKASYLDFI